MIPKELAQRWIDEQVLSAVQMKRIEGDLQEYKKTNSSKNIIMFLSTFGALLIGFAALAFIASNWEMMTPMVRISLFTVLTILSLLFGNYWMSEKKAMPRLGFAFVFLAHLLLGVTLFLIAQQYQVSIDFQWFFVLWFFASIPGIYVYSSRILMLLAIGIFYVWLGYAGEAHLFLHAESIVTLSVLSFFALMTKGLLHMSISQTYQIGRIMFFTGVILSMIFFYFTTFSFFGYAIFPLTQFVGLEWYFALMFALVGLVGVLFLPMITKKIVGGASLPALWSMYGALYLLMIGYLLWPMWEHFPLVMSCVFFFASVGVGYVGYKANTMSYVNLSTFWLLLFILTKYVDVFWSLLPKSLFFFIGGLLLVGLGAFFEKKRKGLQHLITT